MRENEKRAGMALFCTAKPLTDVVIECREVGAARDIPIKTLPCRVQKMEKSRHDVMVLYLKLPANERLQFLAGQYIDILLKDGKRRSFSLANAPHDDEFLQLHVRHIPGGLFTDHVFNSMKEKAILRFEGPHGSFFLREDSDKPIIFVAGGTGFAPDQGHDRTRPAGPLQARNGAVLGRAQPARPVHGRSAAPVAQRACQFQLHPRAVRARCPRTTGKAVPGWCTRRCWTTSPISPATRSMPAARRRWWMPGDRLLRRTACRKKSFSPMRLRFQRAVRGRVCARKRRSRAQ